MTNYGPSSCFLVVGGKDVSGDVYSMEELVESILEETHALGDSWEESLPVGLGKVTLSAPGGLYDDRTFGMLAAMQAQGATLQLVSYGMKGYAAGADIVMLNGTYVNKFKRIATRDGLTKANGEYTITGTYLRGQVISGLSARITDPGNTQSTSVDQSTAPRLPSVTITSNTAANPSVVTATAHGLITGDVVVISGVASSSPTINGERTVTVLDANTFTVAVNVTVPGTGGTFVKVTSTGCVIDLHVPSLTLGGFTSVTVTPQHSADNITFVTLGAAFTTVTTAGSSERQTVAGQVKRYTAMAWDFIGAGSGESAVLYVAISR